MAEQTSDNASATQPSSHPPNKRNKKSRCQRVRWFIESNFAVALVTVVVGGLFGQWITASIQQGLKEREFQQEWLKARGDQALLAHKEYLDKEQEIVNRTYDLIGNADTSAQDLIDLTDTDFDLSNFPRSAQESVRVQAIEMLTNYDKVEQQWGSEGSKLGLLIDYYHPKQPKVLEAWRQTQKSVSDYRKCARQWYKKHLKPVDTTGACEKEKEVMNYGVTEFSATLKEARQYPWEGWESPEKLRSALGGK